MSLEIELPAGWRPRPYQAALWRYLEEGGLRADVAAHRRWGKDDVALNWAAVSAIQRPGVYWHLLPEAAQARKAIWEAVNPHTGRRRIDEAFPPAIRAGVRDGDMSLRLANGSVWQVLGSDNYDSLVGAPPVGVVFSEWALAKPEAWTYIRPILAENGGWALFLWTPRGRNHAVRAFEARARDRAWFTQRSPATETGVFTPAQLARERAELVAETGSKEEGEARFASEYLVDFDAAAPGAYYAGLLGEAQSAGRVGRVPHDPALAVHTAWLYRRIFTYAASAANSAGLAAIILRLDDPVALKWLGLALIGANVVLGTLYMAGATVTDWAKLVAAGRQTSG